MTQLPVAERTWEEVPVPAAAAPASLVSYTLRWPGCCFELPAGHGSPGVLPLAQPQVPVHHCQLRGGEGEEAASTPEWGPGAARLGRGPRGRAPAPDSLAGLFAGSRFRRQSGRNEGE